MTGEYLTVCYATLSMYFLIKYCHDLLTAMNSEKKIKHIINTFWSCIYSRLIVSRIIYKN